MTVHRSVAPRRLDSTRLAETPRAPLSALVLGLGLAAMSAHCWAAEVSTSGNANPVIAPQPVVNLGGTRLFLGGTSGGVGLTGALNVLSGGNLTVAQIVAGFGGLGNGTATIDGAGSIVTFNIGASPFGGLDIGSWGTGSMSITGGAHAVCTPANCPFSNVGNGAGSNGTLTINGAGSSATGLGLFTLGQALVQSGFGTAGATTTAALNILNGAQLATTGNATVSTGPVGALANGNEHTSATVTIAGNGSVWEITRNAVSGNNAFLSVSQRTNATATIDVANGGQLVITGSRLNPAADSSIPGINLSGTGTLAGGSSTLNVDGPGSAVVINGDTGIINIGRNQGTATLAISNGGQVYGGGANGLTTVILGRIGGSGTLTVDGANSLLTISGVGGVNTQGLDNQGGYLGIGREAGGSSTATVSGGGAITVSDGGQAATNGGLAIIIGQLAGSSGSLTVTGPASQVTVEQTGAGTVDPAIVVGRAGTGIMTVTDGAHVAVNGTQQRNFLVGNAVGGQGTLTVSNGAQISASWFAVGNQGGTGTATIDNASILINGFAVNPDNTIFGGSVRVGRGTGSTGTLNLVNGAQITIDTSTADARIHLGGTGALPGGDGTIHMSGGSSISFTGTGATPAVVIGHSGTGFFTMEGSTLNLPSDGRVVLGANSGAQGRLELTNGSSVQAGSLMGIGHDGSASTGGIATVVLDTTSSITANRIVIGSGGCLGGTGTLHGTLIMDGPTSILGCDLLFHIGPTGIGPLGILNPANSPGRIVIDGGFDFISGTIVLEVESDGHGGFLTDEIVFTSAHQAEVDLTGLNVVYSFLGNTDPDAFFASGEWVLDTFFKVNPGTGANAGADLGISALLMGGETLADLFAGSTFAATSPVFTFEDFVFEPNQGVVALVAVPEPGSVALMSACLLPLALIARRRRPAPRA